MDKQGFRTFLQGRKIEDEKIEAALAIAQRFEAFASQRGHSAPSTVDLADFSALLMQEGLNTEDNYFALLLYGRFTQNNAVYAAALEVLDGSEVFENLYSKVGEAYGEEVRDELFAGIDMPPMGTPSTEKPRYMAAILERLEGQFGLHACKALLADSLRTLLDESHLDARQKYRQSQGIDDYLEQEGQAFIELLEKLKCEGRPFFTQEITDEVIEFVEQHPEIKQGVRQGNILYEVKIPYMTREYLAETDEALKRYYYCHCPWVRETLKSSATHISPVFCNCSAGFHKKRWEVIFEQPLQAEIVESVLNGDPWCKIAIHLPADAI